MSDIHLDANFLISVSRASAAYGVGHQFLDSLFGDSNDRVFLTDTVRAEVGRNLNPDANDIFQSWVNRNSNNSLSIQYTGLQPGNNNGERAIVQAIKNNSLYNPPDDSVFIFSSDSRYDWRSDLQGYDYTVNNSINSFNQLLFSGSISYRQYDEITDKLANFVNPSDYFIDPDNINAGLRKYVPGNNYTIDAYGEGTDLAFRVLPDGSILFTDALGRNIEVGADQKFSIADVGGITTIRVEDPSCFTGDTAVEMFAGPQRRIDQIRPGDQVLCYNHLEEAGRGPLVPKRVLRTFTNTAQCVLNFHGVGVTPGHATLCGDGPHAGSHRPIMDILKDDGAIVAEDGSLIRAATHCPVGSEGDRSVDIQIIHRARNKKTGESVVLKKERGLVRAGTRILKPDGTSISFLEIIKEQDWNLQENGLVRTSPNVDPGPLLWAGPGIPRPEDHVLALSGLTLADLYSAEVEVPIPSGPQLSRRPPRHAGMIVN